MRLEKLLIVLLLFPEAAIAQQAGMLQMEQERRLDQSRRSATDPSVDTPYALPTPSVTLETAKADGRAKATVGFAKVQTNYRFTFEAPIGKAADAEASPLSITGLGNDATAEFAVSRLFLFRKYQDSTLLKFCTDNGVPTSKCSDQAFADPKKRQQFIGIAIRQHPWLLSFSGQVGAPAFEYRDRVTLEKVDRKLTSHKLTASYAALFLPDSLFAVNLTHARSYNASKDTTTLCTPLDGTAVAGAVRCDDVIRGEPTSKDVWGMTLEFRHQIVKENVPMFGLRPRKFR